MPKQVKARAAQDTQEERMVRKLVKSHHAPADWKFHAQMVLSSWAGIRKRCASTWRASMPRESLGWACDPDQGASRG